jgi:hypothetical protein
VDQLLAGQRLAGGAYGIDGGHGFRW